LNRVRNSSEDVETKTIHVVCRNNKKKTIHVDEALHKIEYTDKNNVVTMAREVSQHLLRWMLATLNHNRLQHHSFLIPCVTSGISQPKLTAVQKLRGHASRQQNPPGLPLVQGSPTVVHSSWGSFGLSAVHPTKLSGGHCVANTHVV